MQPFPIIAASFHGYIRFSHVHSAVHFSTTYPGDSVADLAQVASFVGFKDFH